MIIKVAEGCSISGLSDFKIKDLATINDTARFVIEAKSKMVLDGYAMAAMPMSSENYLAQELDEKLRAMIQGLEDVRKHLADGDISLEKEE